MSLGVDPGAVLDLSLSLNPCSSLAASRAARHLDALRRYPDEALATGALAEALGVDATRVLLTNGGAEGIALVAAEAVEGWVEGPEFSLYARHLRLRRGAGRWRSNPNNPTGWLAGADSSAAVWDEAFWPLATGTWSRGDAERGSLVVGSLTKLFACPGLRMGYVLGPDPESVERLRRRRPAWSVGGLACAVLPELIAGADLPGWASETAALRLELVGLLRHAGLDPLSAYAPWVLVPGAGELREQLARRGVLVRDCASFGLVDTVRIAVPSASGMERLAAALASGPWARGRS
ncbi:MAG: aminotransferase class I/II-fold pyridoxal phosphate-dependent enzyme [Acidimicrobiia bacterium]